MHKISNVPASLDKCHGNKKKQFSTGLGNQKVGKPKKPGENKKKQNHQDVGSPIRLFFF